MVSVEDKFKAAVEIVQNLPKDGTFQPSNEVMLSFYSFYKQATEGPCRTPKPSFWDFVNKAKWDAWQVLGDMPKEDAMNKYVDELISIIETMSYTENVAEFLNLVGPPFELELKEDEEKDSGDNIMKHDNSSDEFSDSYDYLCELNGNKTDVIKQVASHTSEYEHLEFIESDSLALTVMNIQHSLDEVLQRCNNLEKLLQENKGENLPFLNISHNATVLIILWPFAVHLIFYILGKQFSKRKINNT